MVNNLPKQNILQLVLNDFRRHRALVISSTTANYIYGEAKRQGLNLQGLEWMGRL